MRWALVDEIYTKQQQHEPEAKVISSIQLFLQSMEPSISGVGDLYLKFFQVS